MKFKVKKGTKLFIALDEVRLEVNRCNKEAIKIVKELGFDEYHRKSFVAAGGISAFRSEIKKKGYSYAYGNKDKEAIFPSRTKANRELIERIENLPTVSYSEINDLLKYDGRKSRKFNSNGGRYISFLPGIIWGNEVILIDVPEYIDYKPVANMIEIKESEFKKLSNKK